MDDAGGGWADARNVVLVCLDGVRKDYFDRFAPRLSARAGIAFEQCRAASSWRAPAHASALTGVLPHRHGVHAHDPGGPRLDRRDTCLADVPDHAAVGVRATDPAGSTVGLDRVFDAFVDVDPGTRYPEGLDPGEFARSAEGTGLACSARFVRRALDHDRPARSLLNGVLSVLDGASVRAPVPKLLDDGANVVARSARRQVDRVDEPYFLYASFVDATAPYRPIAGFDPLLYDAPNGGNAADLEDPGVHLGWEVDGTEPALDRLRTLYAASVDYLDRRVAALVDGLLASSDRETTVVITAGHGVNLGYAADDRLVGHGGSLSEGVLHVPLLVIDPPVDAQDASPGYVSQLALGRLVSSMARGAFPDVSAERIPAEVVGVGTTAGPTAERRRAAGAARRDRMIRCVYDAERKYVWDSLGAAEAYALEGDRRNWQGRVAEGVDVPPWARARFAVEIGEYRRRAVEGGAAFRRPDERIDERPFGRPGDPEHT